MKLEMASTRWGRLATEVFQETNLQGKSASIQVLLADLKACSRSRDLQRGKKVHAEAVACGHDSSIYVLSTLVRMYMKCGSVADARQVFDSIQRPDAVCWNNLLLGYAENGHGLHALSLFSRMKASRCAPDSVTYVAALKACTSLVANGDNSGKKNCLERGKEIHSEIGSQLDHYLQSALIGMYAKCGSMVDARSVFNSMHKPDVVSWTALLLGYAENGQGLVALDLFSSMKATGCSPDSVTYVSALKACTSLAMAGDRSGKNNCLRWGREIHSEIGSKIDRYVQNALIDMYAKCGSIVEARQVFDSMEKPNVVSWNSLLQGYAENGEGLAALDLFARMKSTGCAPDSVTYLAALNSCASLAVDGDSSGRKNCLEKGREVHLEIGGNLDLYIQSALIDMYAKCGSVVDARQVFDSIQKPDVVCWNTLLLGYAENGEGLVVLDMLSRMKAGGIAPNSVTYVAALKACGLIGALALGRKLHSEITVFSAPLVGCLVDFYAKCGSMVDARGVFDLHPRTRDITTWNALLAGYGKLGDSASMFHLFEAMHDEGFWPDAVTFVCMLSCCSHAGLVDKAREYFDRMNVQYGVTPGITHYNCMVDVLGRANLLNEAMVLLRRMPCNPDAVTWMALLGACRKWKNVEIGSMASQLLVGIDEKLASADVLMAHICGSTANQDRVLDELREDGVHY